MMRKNSTKTCLFACLFVLLFVSELGLTHCSILGIFGKKDKVCPKVEGSASESEKGEESHHGSAKLHEGDCVIKNTVKTSLRLLRPKPTSTTSVKETKTIFVPTLTTVYDTKIVTSTPSPTAVENIIVKNCGKKGSKRDDHDWVCDAASKELKKKKKKGSKKQKKDKFSSKKKESDEEPPSDSCPEKKNTSGEGVDDQMLLCKVDSSSSTKKIGSQKVENLQCVPVDKDEVAKKKGKKKTKKDKAAAACPADGKSAQCEVSKEGETDSPCHVTGAHTNKKKEVKLLKKLDKIAKKEEKKRQKQEKKDKNKHEKGCEVNVNKSGDKIEDKKHNVNEHVRCNGTDLVGETEKKKGNFLTRSISKVADFVKIHRKGNDDKEDPEHDKEKTNKDEGKEEDKKKCDCEKNVEKEHEKGGVKDYIFGLVKKNNNKKNSTSEVEDDKKEKTDTPSEKEKQSSDKDKSHDKSEGPEFKKHQDECSEKSDSGIIQNIIDLVKKPENVTDVMPKNETYIEVGNDKHHNKANKDKRESDKKSHKEDDEKRYEKCDKDKQRSRKKEDDDKPHVEEDKERKFHGKKSDDHPLKHEGNGKHDKCPSSDMNDDKSLKTPCNNTICEIIDLFKRPENYEREKAGEESAKKVMERMEEREKAVREEAKKNVEREKRDDEIERERRESLYKERKDMEKEQREREKEKERILKELEKEKKQREREEEKKKQKKELDKVKKKKNLKEDCKKCQNKHSLRCKMVGGVDSTKKAMDAIALKLSGAAEKHARKIGHDVSEGASDLKTGIKNSFGRLGGKVEDGLHAVAGNLKNAVKKGSAKVEQEVESSVSKVAQHVGYGVEKVKDGLKKGAENMKDSLKRGVENAREDLEESAIRTKHSIGKQMKTIGKDLKDGTKKVYESVGGGVDKAVHAAKDKVEDGLQSAKEKMKMGLSRLGDGAKHQVDIAKDGMIRGMKYSADYTEDRMRKGLHTMKDSMKTSMDSLGKDAKKMGKDLKESANRDLNRRMNIASDKLKTWKSERNKENGEKSIGDVLKSHGDSFKKMILGSKNCTCERNREFPSLSSIGNFTGFKLNVSLMNLHRRSDVPKNYTSIFPNIFSPDYNRTVPIKNYYRNNDGSFVLSHIKPWNFTQDIKNMTKSLNVTKNFSANFTGKSKILLKTPQFSVKNPLHGKKIVVNMTGIRESLNASFSIKDFLGYIRSGGRRNVTSLLGQRPVCVVNDNSSIGLNLNMTQFFMNRFNVSKLRFGNMSSRAGPHVKYVLNRPKALVNEDNRRFSLSHVDGRKLWERNQKTYPSCNRVVMNNRLVDLSCTWENPVASRMHFSKKNATVHLHPLERLARLNNLNMTAGHLLNWKMNRTSNGTESYTIPREVVKGQDIHVCGLDCSKPRRKFKLFSFEMEKPSICSKSKDDLEEDSGITNYMSWKGKFIEKEKQRDADMKKRETEIKERKVEKIKEEKVKDVEMSPTKDKGHYLMSGVISAFSTDTVVDVLKELGNVIKYFYRLVVDLIQINVDTIDYMVNSCKWSLYKGQRSVTDLKSVEGVSQIAKSLGSCYSNTVSYKMKRLKKLASYLNPYYIIELLLLVAVAQFFMSRHSFSLIRVH